MLIYYSDMFPARRAGPGSESWLQRHEVNAYVENEFVPAALDAYRLQANGWRFPWHLAWTAHGSVGGPKQLAVALAPPDTWYHGQAPGNGHAGISINVDAVGLGYATLLDGMMSTFNHELFHNLQRGLGGSRLRANPWWMYGPYFLLYFLPASPVLLAGVLPAALAQLLITALAGSNVPTVGASGALYALLLAFGMLFPNRVIMPLFPPIPMKARTFVIVFGALELLLGLMDVGGVATMQSMKLADGVPVAMKMDMGDRGWVLTQFDKKVQYVFNPQTKVAMKTPLPQDTNIKGEMDKQIGKFKKEGVKVTNDTVDGLACWKVATAEGAAWMDKNYGLPRQMESGGKVTKLKYEAINAVPDSVFQLPAGTKVQDMADVMKQMPKNLPKGVPAIPGR